MRSSRRDFIRRTLFGAAIAHLLPHVTSASAKDDSGLVDRRRLGRTAADVSILGLGLGGAFMEGYEDNLDVGHALGEAPHAKGNTNWDTPPRTAPSEEMIARGNTRKRERRAGGWGRGV
jgi:hypothetical protein